MEILHSDHYGRKRSVSDVAQYPYRMNPTETSTNSGSSVLGGLKKRLHLRPR